MDDNFKILENKLIEITNKKWIKSIRKGPTGIGRTFEFLIGKNEESFSFPDYMGIEIKTRRYKSKQDITLLALEPDGEGFFESKRILTLYGYNSKKNLQFKVFYGTFSSNKNYIINNCLFSIKIDYLKEKIYLSILNKKNNINDLSTYWSFKKLEEAIKRKLNYLALIKAESIIKNGDEYFKYTKIIKYKNISFKKFLVLLNSGKIKINFAIGVFSGEYRYGEIHNHGTEFRLSENNLKLLYNEVEQ